MVLTLTILTPHLNFIEGFEASSFIRSGGLVYKGPGSSISANHAIKQRKLYLIFSTQSLQTQQNL